MFSVLSFFYNRVGDIRFESVSWMDGWMSGSPFGDSSGEIAFQIPNRLQFIFVVPEGLLSSLWLASSEVQRTHLDGL